MGKKKYGDVIIESKQSDHSPFHVHITVKGKFIGRYDLENQEPMENWKMTKRIRKALKHFGYLREV